MKLLITVPYLMYVIYSLLQPLQPPQDLYLQFLRNVLAINTSYIRHIHIGPFINS